MAKTPTATAAEEPKAAAVTAEVKAPAPAVVAPAAAPAPAPTSFPLGLDAFCRELSLVERRPEMIAAFHRDEFLAGRTTDTRDGFQARLAAFRRRPV